MKKKIFTGLTMALCVCINAAGAAYFLKDGGGGDALTPETAQGSITMVFNKVNPAGGDTIVVCGNFGLADYVAPAHTGEVVITQVYNGVDYRTNEDQSINYFYDKTKGRRFTMNGPVKFENINFKSGGGSLTYILFIANYHPITMGKGIYVDDSGFAYTGTASSLCILGGYQDTKESASRDLDARITIESGKFMVIGFNRNEGSGATYTGNSYIDVSGGEITHILGSELKGMGGNLNVNVSGGKVSGTIYAGYQSIDPTKNSGSRSSEVTISAGDFSTCQAIIGLLADEDLNAGKTSSIDYCTHSQRSDIADLASGFTTVADCFTTGIENAVNGGMQIRIVGKTVILPSGIQDKAEVFNMTGHRVYSGFNTEIELPQSGVYAVKINETIEKILIQ